MFSTSRISALIATTVCVAAAHANVTLYDQGGSTGALVSPGFFTTNFNSNSATAGTLAFTLNGYGTLDGNGNGFTDFFHLAMNGAEVFSGSFGLGGGGTDVVYLNTVGATYVANTSTEVTRKGGSVVFTVPFSVVAGNNNLTFSYDGVYGQGPGGLGASQGLADEAWGITGAKVTSAVPEPVTSAMWLAGLGVAGVARRRQRTKAA